MKIYQKYIPIFNVDCAEILYSIFYKNRCFKCLLVIDAKKMVGFVFFVAMCFFVSSEAAIGQDMELGGHSINCGLSTENNIECGAGINGPRMNLSLDILSDRNDIKEISRAEFIPGQGFYIEAGRSCGRILINSMPIKYGLNISAETTCNTPVQLCVNMHVSGSDLKFKNSVAIVEEAGVMIGVQSDERLGTEIDANKKIIRLCSNPVRNEYVGWSLSIFSGTNADVKNALQSIRPRILGTKGELLGYPKMHPVVKEGYLFVDMTEDNYASILSFAKQGGFPYVLIYAGTWASSLGSYQFNKKNYPNGLLGLQRVVKAANSLGIKVGLHTLTSFVSKTDPYVANRTGAGLLKDDKTFLLQDISSTDSMLTATDSAATFPTQPAYYGNTKAGLDLLVDKEIISCRSVQKKDRGVFNKCKRGLYGTEATPHFAGTAIMHIAERYGSYLADLRGPLKEEIAKRIADLVNEAEIDMIYFDGGEVGSANGDPGWFVAEQQIEILKKVRRPILVEGSGIVPRLWPYLTRMVDDDFATLAAISYLDKNKIKVHKIRADDFMPDNLGWLGLLKETKSFPATTPEEISTYIARSISVGAPVSIETYHDNLINNPYTSRLMDILKFGNDFIRNNGVTAGSSPMLRAGEWLFTGGDNISFRRIRSLNMPFYSGEVIVPLNSNGDEKNITFRVRNVRSSTVGNKNNIPLFLAGGGAKRLVPPITADAGGNGLLIEAIDLTDAAPLDFESSFVDFKRNSYKNNAFDLSTARTMLVEFGFEGAGKDKSGDPCAVLNFQLQDNKGQYRDYLLRVVPGRNQKVVLDYEGSAPDVLNKYFPASSNYAFKAAVYGFEFSSVTKLNIRWMKACSDASPVYINKVSMLAESPSLIENLSLIVDGESYLIASAIKTGQTLDVSMGGVVSICNGANCVEKYIKWPSGKAVQNSNISVRYQNSGAVADISVGLVGEGVFIGN